MSKKKTYTAEENFALAIKNHQGKNFKIAKNFYYEVLKIKPDHLPSHANIGVIFKQLGETDKAIKCFKKLIEINSRYEQAYNNLGVIFNEINDDKNAISYFEKAIEIKPNYADAHYNLGVVYKKNKKSQMALICFKKAIQIQPDHANAYYNLGIIFDEFGDLEKEINSFKKATEIQRNHTNAHYNLGLAFIKSGDRIKAINCFKETIKMKPNYSDAYWCLHSFSSDIDEAIQTLKKLYSIDNEFFKAEIMISALKAFKGDYNDFNALANSSKSNHPNIRSIKWIFSLPKLPKIYFNQWDFFDEMMKLTDRSKPFYEFGVRNGISFRYLINTFNKGFGFDTFSGLPESWGNEPEGTYSTFGTVPKVDGGEFIVGDFKNTLPKFFSEKRPIASLINFDADLYSSTICALNYSNKVINGKSILLFDEFLMNEKWEDDEYKALNEFCNTHKFSYEVLAVCLFSKQVAVKIKKN